MSLKKRRRWVTKRPMRVLFLERKMIQEVDKFNFEELKMIQGRVD